MSTQDLKKLREVILQDVDQKLSDKRSKKLELKDLIPNDDMEFSYDDHEENPLSVDIMEQSLSGTY